MEQFFQILSIFFFVFLNGFFVAAEFSIVKVRASQIKQLSLEGDIRAKFGNLIIQEMDAYLSAVQIGITLASLALGWIGKPFLAHQLEPILENIGIRSQTLIDGISLGVAFGIITYLHIVLGEMAPKSLALRLAEKTFLLIAIPLYIFYKIFIPFIWVLNNSSLLFLKLFGFKVDMESELAHSEEELKLIFADSAKSGHLTRQEVEFLENVLALHDKSAKQIMIPSTAVVYLSTTNTFSENLRITKENNHARYPLCEGDLDHVLGMIHIKDILAATTRGKNELRMIDLKRDVLFYPETIDLDALFREFQQTKSHMAILIGEYGETTGIATLEDVLEELVGEIYDEFDQPVHLIRQVGRREYLLDGLCPVKLCEETLEVELPQFEVETVGGIVLSMAGHIPEPGFRQEFDYGTFIVDAIDHQRIAKLRLILKDKKTESTTKGS